MSTQRLTPLKTILGAPEVRAVVDAVSSEALRRKRYRPRICHAFEQPFTVLEERGGYRFDIDRTAAQQLDRIIANRVQAVVGVADLEADARKNYHRKRRIGVVFSGGPAPGGHNVIAGIYDAAKAANPDSTVYGFLLGPDGVIENEAIELTGEIVDAYRNLGGFGMIRTGRTKIDTQSKMELSRRTCKDLCGLRL